MDISLGPLATESPCICILLFSSTIYSVGKCSGRVARKDMVYVPPPSHQNVTLDTATIQPGLHTFTVRLHFCYSSPNILPSTGGATSGHGAWRSKQWARGMAEQLTIYARKYTANNKHETGNEISNSPSNPKHIHFITGGPPTELTF